MTVEEALEFFSKNVPKISRTKFQGRSMMVGLSYVKQDSSVHRAFFGVV